MEEGELSGQLIGSEPKRIGQATGFTCPECGGGLWESREGDVLQYRCHVGHGFSADSLLAEQSHALEGALWTAFRALKERAALGRRLAARSRERGHTISATRFEHEAADADERAATVHKALSKGSDGQANVEEGDGRASA